MSVGVNLVYLNGTFISIFFLSPLLLLLNQDGYFFKNLKENNRYFPMIATISILLSFSTSYHIFIVPLFSKFGIILSSSLSLSLFQFIKNVLLFFVTLPSHYFFNLFLWTFQKQNQLLWIFITPINILPTIFANVNEINILGILGILFGIIQYWIEKKKEKYGKQII